MWSDMNPDQKRGHRKPWKNIMKLGRKQSLDSKQGSPILPLPYSLDQIPPVKRRRLHYTSITLLGLFFCNINPLLSPRFIQDSGHRGGWSYQVRKYYVCKLSVVDPKDHTFKHLCFPSTPEEIHWSFRYRFVLLKNICKGGGKKTPQTTKVSDHQVGPSCI